MPPKPKYSKEEIITASFELARERGISAVVAREVGKRLGTSSSPIFTVFHSMDELLQEVVRMAWERFNQYLSVADCFTPSFKMRGLQFIHFAQDEPKLFQMLFMQEEAPMEFNTMMQQRVIGFQADLAIIQNNYHVSPEQAQRLFQHVWVCAYGICVLCATGICTLSEQELNSMLGSAFAGQMMLIKSGASSFHATPAPRESETGKQMNHAFPEFEQQ